MRRRAFGILALALALGSCSTLTSAGEPPPPGALVRVTVAVPHGAGLYIEGAVRYLHITGPAIDTQLQLNQGGATAVSLPGGQTYQLESWARPCDGNCGNLDGPTDRCTETFPLESGKTTAIEITAPPGKPCTMAVIPTDAAQ
jgi:hypothetical protein